ncbi:cold shock domain-containing protein [Streptomyces sp. SA15]|jgi:cold shock CspA family protein|nr:cold shock domain-containing protein [Streptomyces sp. SA15]
MARRTVKYQRVEFTAAQSPKGPQADQVRAL